MSTNIQTNAKYNRLIITKTFAVSTGTSHFTNGGYPWSGAGKQRRRDRKMRKRLVPENQT